MSSIFSSKKRKIAADLLDGRDVHLPVLYYLLAELVGEGFQTQDPLLLFRELEEYTGLPELSTDVENRVNALLLLLTHDGFYEDPVSFIAVTNTINNGDPDVDEWEIPSMEDVVWAITEVAYLDESPPEFSTEVSQVIAEIIREEAHDDDGMDTTYLEQQYSSLKKQLELITGKSLDHWPEKLSETLSPPAHYEQDS